jgi:xylitol oxidase
MADLAPRRWATNWSGHVTLARARVHEPAKVAEIQRIVAGSRSVRVIGSGHSFNDLADTDGDLLWLGRLDPGIDIDRDRGTVTFSAGLTYDDLCPILHQAGFALPNTASLRHVTVAGACATATHGSGDTLGNLATSVSALELVVATGDRITLSRSDDPDRFPGAVVALGALGVVTRLTLDLVPAFEIRQHVYAELPLDSLDANFDHITSAGYSVSLFPTWQQPACESVWVKHLLHPGGSLPPPPAELFGAALQADHLPPAKSDRTRTPLHTAGPWHHRLPHFELTDPRAVGDELQSEYFVPRPHARAAIAAVAAVGPRMASIIGVSELRTVAADDLWLSPAYGTDVVAIHFNWLKDGPGVAAFLPELEAALAPFQPRPHWGKLFALPPDRVRAGFPRLADFRALAAELDPDGCFRNRYLRTHLFDRSREE